ncbi:hypothetical protein NQ176_g2154 [Zarea fungicola]|uniref:Uncharacterized protein n=1 Tax=Zarea fungicola TaxID=93591 RepID=A0ACC1NRL5_9HYPO|nr:hypothetical protein NQ176_g2154 [Lecanicillium fungicola]
MAPAAVSTGPGHVRFIPCTYNPADSEASARKLIFTIAPQWAKDDYVEFVRFTDGITNTLLKAVNRRPGLSAAEIDRDAILLRAYGNGTDILIDREREAANHELLMKYNLAPALLARFANGMLYRFIPGGVAQPKDLPDQELSKAIARRLAQWHATVPCLPDSRNSTANIDLTGNSSKAKIANAAPGKPVPNLWSTIQKWILALPSKTGAERARQSSLQTELELLVKQLSQRPGFGQNGLVFAHCDLLSANVIIHRDDGKPLSVSFIDYEYGTPSPAAFDIANHFAEWAGYDCDYADIPKHSQRLAFVREYIERYAQLSEQDLDIEHETTKMMQDVDDFRGVPGFYWGIWAAIQATISKIDFDYASYAELRLGEYWACKYEQDGTRAATGKEKPLREVMWSSE